MSEICISGEKQLNITILTRHLVGVTCSTGVSAVTNAGISVTTSVTWRHLVQSGLACHTRLTLLTRPGFLWLEIMMSKKLITAACSRKLPMLSPWFRFRLSQCPHPALIRHKMSQSVLSSLTVMQSALERHSNSIFLLFQGIQLLPLSPKLRPGNV